MSYTARPSRTRTQTRTTTRTRTETDENEKDGDIDEVRCSGHNQVCSKLVAGPSSKNPGRAFFTCPLGRDHPDKCRFFKWADELAVSPRIKRVRRDDSDGGQTLGARGGGGGEASWTIGQALEAGPSVTPRTQRAQAAERRLAAFGEGPRIDDDADAVGTLKDDVDVWADDDSLGPAAADAHANAPALADRFRAVANCPRDDDVKEERTPTRARDADANPFLSPDTPSRRPSSTSAAHTPSRTPTATGAAVYASPTPSTPSHPALSPAISSLLSVSEHLARQDRLLRAAEQMKAFFRKQNEALRAENDVLKRRVAELEARGA
ncbi:hypothetical protein Q5752_001303 [Cryptotrichosporon argae]